MGYKLPDLLARLTSAYTKKSTGDPGLPTNAVLALDFSVETNDRPAYGQTKDTSGFNRHGTLKNSPKTAVGRLGGAYEMDPTTQNYVEVAHHPDLNLNGSWTLLLDVRMLQSDAANRGLLRKGAGATSGLGYELLHDNTGRLVLKRDGTSYSSDPSILKVAWHNVAYTYDGSTLKLYIDGVLSKTFSSVTFATNNDSGVLQIGKGVSDYGNQQMSRVRLVNRLLNATEVATYAWAGHAKNVAKLAQAFRDGYWAETERDMEDLREAAFPATARGKSLDKWAKVVNLLRKTGESDADYLIRIKGQIRRRYGGVTVDDMLEFVESVIGAQPGDVTIAENSNTSGSWKDSYFRITFDLGLLANLGYTPADYTRVIDLINDTLNFVAAAGVKGEVVVQGGGTWDSSAYDGSGVVFGQ